jgi:glycosyltransferase involved in cell wall biosynthesis
LVKPLVFGGDPLPDPLPGMSDVMPYPSSRFSELTSEQLAAYRKAWRNHLANVIQEFRPDVIHSHHVWLLSSMVKDLAPGVPVVTHCHGTGIRQLALCPGLADEVRRGCSRNDAFIVLHRGHAETLSAELGIPVDKMNIVGSGFRDDVFHADGRDRACGPVLTYAGKLSRAKGLPWLLEAMEELAERVPGLVLNIAGSGSGPEADAIRKRIDEMANVEFHGQLDQGNLANLLRRSSVFVLPSFYEGLPLVLVEAAACGCRLVATALPGVVEQLAPQLGSTLELVSLPRLENTDNPVTEDLPSFVRQLARVIEVSVLRPLPEDTGQRVEGMTWNAVYERIEKVWRRVASLVPGV